MPSGRALELWRRSQKRSESHRQMVGDQVVASVTPERDTIILDGPSGLSEPIPIQHPFLATNSWIRAVPTKRTGMKTLQGVAKFDRITLGYHLSDRQKLIEKYLAKQGMYRPLTPGEIEISSSGLAQSYWSDRGRQESRGGIVNAWQDNDTLESGAWAPIHRRLLMTYRRSAGIKDEERLGVVTRPDPESLLNVLYPKVDDKFARERLVAINDGDDNPLLDIREGHVITNDGKEETGKTGKSLRSRRSYFTKDGTEVRFEIDNEGNVYVSLPDGASEGLEIDIPAGAVKATVNKELSITAYENELVMDSNGIRMKAKNGAELKITNAGATINGHKLVYHEFLDYFGQTHLTSTGLGLMGWPVAHNPSTIAAFNAQNSIPGKFKSDSGTI